MFNLRLSIQVTFNYITCDSAYFEDTVRICPGCALIALVPESHYVNGELVFGPTPYSNIGIYGSRFDTRVYRDDEWADHCSDFLCDCCKLPVYLITSRHPVIDFVNAMDCDVNDSLLFSDIEDPDMSNPPSPSSTTH